MWIQRKCDEIKESKLLKMGKNQILSKLLSQRNIKDEELENFLASDYKNLSHPHSLQGVKEAVEVFHQTKMKAGTVAVYSDFDSDGVLSAVSIKELCNVFEMECKVILPSRVDQGYGLNPKSIALIKETLRIPPDLLFIADCGSSSENEIKELKEWSPHTRIVIIDHHEINQETISKSADVLINWHQTNSQEMCAAGEVFQFIRGIRWVTKRVNPIEFLSITAIATIADVSPIVGDNRLIVKHGLTSYALNHVLSNGINALLQVSYIKPEVLSQMDVQFKIAPVINASGRLYHPKAVYDLLIERDMQVAINTAEHVLRFNKERKEIQKTMEEKAIELAKKSKCKNGILVYDESFHVGVVGIVAAKLVEKFGVPAIVIGKVGDKWKGSCRSISNVNIKEILDKCPELFDSYGGHAMAAGVTIKADKIEVAAQVFDKACMEYCGENNITKDNKKYYDIEIDLDQVDTDMSRLLIDTIYPYCEENNKEPIFMVKDVEITGTTVKEGGTWRLLSFYARNDKKAVSFPFKFFTTKFGTEIEGKKADILFTFPQRREFGCSARYDWSGKFELTVKDIVV